MALAGNTQSSWFSPHASGTTPSPRFGHSVSFVGSKIVLIGGSGSNEVHVLDTVTMSWVRPRVSGTPPAGRQGHSATVIGKKIFVFGGGTSGTFYNDFHVLDTDIMRWHQPQTRGLPPRPRLGHAAARVGTRIFMFFGGAGSDFFDDVWCIDTDTMTWTQIDAKGRRPEMRAFHTASSYGTKIVLFGGNAGDRYYNDVHVFDTDSMHWDQPKVAGKPPRGRSRHVTLIVRGHVYVVGGTDGQNATNDVHVLDQDTLTWHKDEPGGSQPAVRLSHAAVLIGDRIFVIGGHDGARALNDCVVLDTRPMAWVIPEVEGTPPGALVGHTMTTVGSKIYVLGGASGGQARSDVHMFDPSMLTWWYKLPVGGPVPDSIISHTAEAAGEQIWVFGGGDGKKTGAEQVYVLDTAHMMWSTPAMEGNGPGGRVGHTCTCVGRKLYVFGGFGQTAGYTGYVNDIHVIDTETATWFRPFENGTPPAPRLGHSAVRVGAKVLVFGGAAAGRVFNDLHVLDTESMTWSAPAVKGMVPLGRYGHTAVAVGKKMFIFGGVSGNRSLSDFHMLDFDTLTWYEPGITGVPPAPRSRHAMAVQGTKLCIFGGSDNNLYFSDLFLLNTATGVQYDATEVSAAVRLEGIGASAGVSGATITDVAGWLRGIGMGRYADLFVQHEIDPAALMQLSDHDLRDVGVTAVGARKTILDHLDRVKELRKEIETKDVHHGEELYQNRYRILKKQKLANNVKKAVDLHTNQTVLLKFMDNFEEFNRELELRKALSSDIIAKLLAHYEDLVGHAHCLVFESGESTLRDFLDNSALQRNERKSVFERVCRILENLHSRNVVLCDLKPANIMLIGYKWKIADFELARNFGERVPTKFSTNYCPPELARAVMDRRIDSMRAEPSYDIWTLGLVLFELFAQHPLFSDDPETLLPLSTFDIDIPTGNIDDSQARNLLLWCLERDPAERPDIYQVMDHAYLLGGFDPQQEQKTFGGVSERQRRTQELISEMGDVLLSRLRIDYAYDWQSAQQNMY